MIFRRVSLTLGIPIISILFILSTINSFGQLSQGGFPLEVTNLKSATLTDKVVIMSSFRLTHEDSITKTDNLKILKFAHSFPVSLTPQNSGTWYDIDGYRVWQVVIQSKGAYSLNIIFSKFSIPDGARLFVFDREKNVILGAFTSRNNKPYKKLAIYPLPGDELIVQYEEPNNPAFEGELEIGEINHDYKGVFSLNNRWKRRPSEECNVDVQCEFASGLENEKRSTCRVLAGQELGTATLINNVLNDGKPYVISAFHIYDDDSETADVAEKAKIAIYDFNYESPECTGIDGYDNQSVSGSEAKASFDSLDLMLVELSEIPPPAYRPYYSGWDATHNKPYNSYVIHHPNGDTKKISHDTGICDSARYSKNFVDKGHWKVLNWETGSTEGGSSGAGLFNNDKRLVGILSGGNASCSEKSYDLFARIDKQWDYLNAPEKQLKKWLDPGNTGTLKIDGYDPYQSTSKECKLVSNFVTEDIPVVLPKNSGSQGIYTGNNKMNISEIAEEFSGFKRAVLNGVTIGILNFKNLSVNPEITIRIYTGDTIPNFAVKQFKFPISNLTSGAMNFLNFPEPVDVEGNFFISIVIPEFDSLSIFQSAFRPIVLQNTMLVKQNDVWKPINRITSDQNNGASLLMQAMVCDASFPQSVDTTKSDDLIFYAFPNPATDYLVLEFKKRVPSYQFSMFDMTGRLILSDVFENRMYSEINTSGLQPGIYLIRVSNGELSETKRVVIN